MIALITLLISLLGYGSPADFENYNEAELNEQIEMAQEESESGNGNPWDFPVNSNPNEGE